MNHHNQDFGFMNSGSGPVPPPVPGQHFWIDNNHNQMIDNNGNKLEFNDGVIAP